MSSNKIHWSELVSAAMIGGLLFTFLALLVYAYAALNINVPACLTASQPFEKGEVITRYDVLTSQEKYEVHVVAKMWQFEPSDIFVRAGSRVEFYLSSADVNHGFQIAKTGVNLMAVPGALNYASLTFDEPGEYRIICHEYCGLGHHNMMGKITVVPAGYKGDLATYSPTKMAAATPAPSLSSKAQLGMKVFKENGCAACHSVDGMAGVGPTLKGLFGTEVPLEGGKVAVADEVYLRESIVNPSATIVKGFQPLMPPTPLSAENVDALIEYIRSLQR